MNCVGPKDPKYNQDRVISNARFDYFPRTICYCDCADDVSSVIRDAQAKGLAVRIRSGGHQHEGMCTGNGVVLIDLSGINAIEYRIAEQRAWIGAGATLNDVYASLWHNSYIFAGGGCGDVHVGGLTHGGGWGPQGRRYGLTCDSLVGVEMVTARGDIVTVSREGGESDRALLRALRGGGGGNFGVVTKFCFRLHRWTGDLTTVNLTWDEETLQGDRLDRFVMHWVNSFPRDPDNNLTTFLRISTLGPAGGDRVVMGGRYVGSPDQAKARVHALLAGQPGPTGETYPKVPRTQPVAESVEPDPRELEILRRALGTLPGYQPGPERAESIEAPGGEPDLSETCAGVPLRHKISSGFARRPLDVEAVRVMNRIIRTSEPWPDSRLYLSLHCLGGAMADEGDGSSYAFRDRDVLLQFQAWWLPDAARLDDCCIAWIERFRKAMTPYTDGAFINFIDRDIALDEYYKSKFQPLIVTKRQWDPDNFFRFEMSIPTK